MKWIGQHIWNLTSRFRDDVYFEGLAETEETRGLVVDANGKVSINPLSGDEHATHIYENVRNDEGSTIPVGTPVYSKGEIGGSERIKVGVADASDPAKMPAIGITNTELTTTGDTKDGLITLVGVYNTNISDPNFVGLNVNDIVYVAPGGRLTTTKPTGTNLIQNIGIILKTNGNTIQGLQVTCIGRTNDVPTPLYIDHTNQRVGIGATSPTEKLEVSGNINASGGIQVGFGTFSGTSDTVTDAAIVIPENNAIYTLDGGQYLRNLIRKDSDVIKIGQPGTALVDEIRFLPGTLGFTSFYGDATEVARILANGNVGIGQTAPQTMLHLTTTMSSSPTTKLYLDVDGSNIDGGGAEIIFNSSASSGTPTAYNAKISGTRASSAAGSSQLGFWTTEASINPAPQERMRIDKDGNVGIGTTSPTNKLHVVGDTRIEGDLTVNGTYTQIDTDVLTTEQWLVTNDGTGPAAVINQLGSQDIFDVQDDGTSVFYIEDGGQIGIGTTSPTARLHIESADDVVVRLKSTDNKAYIALSDNDTDGYISSENSRLSLGANPYADANNLNIDLSNNNIGIGTTSPTSKLHVVGDIAVSTGNFIVDAGNTNKYIQLSDGSANMIYSAYSKHIWKTYNGVAYGERMTLTSTGELGIGTTSPSGKLHISSGGSPSIIIQDTDGTDQYATINHNNGSNQYIARNNTSNGQHVWFGQTGVSSFTERMRIDAAGNVGIGTTSPSAKLEVSAGGTTSQEIAHFGNSNDVGKIKMQLNSAGAGKQQILDGDNNVDIVLDAQGDSYFNVSHGNVGIGTDSPNYLLDVEKSGANARIFNTAASTELFLQCASGYVSSINFGDTSDNNAGRIIYREYDHAMTFTTNTSEAMFIDSSQRVGIGTSSPDSLLHVSADVSSGGVTNTGTITIEGRPAGYLGDDIATIDFHNTGVKYADIRMERGNAANDSQLVFSTSDTGTLNDALIINEVGNVGIGTTSPDTTLDVSGNAKTSGSIAAFGNDTSGFSGHGMELRVINGVGSLLSYNRSTSTRMPAEIGGSYVMFDVGGAEKMRVDTSGNVGIGTSSPSQKLDVNGNMIANAYYVANTSNYIDIATGLRLRSNSDGIRFMPNGTDTVKFLANGNVGIGTTSPGEKLEVDGNIKIGDSDEVRFGADNDLRIYHDGSNSYIDQIGTGNLYIRNTQEDGLIYMQSNYNGSVSSFFYLHGAYSSSNPYTIFPNNSIAAFGNSADLRIYHDGSNSYIDDTGTGHLNIRATNLQLLNAAGNKYYASFADGGDAKLFYNGSEKLATTSTGVEVTGNISLSGSVQRQISTTHHTFTFGAAGSAAQDYWVPFIGSSEQAAPNVTHRTIAPYGGILKKAIVHSTVAYGSSAQVRFHRIDNGTTSVFVNDNSTDDVTTNVTADMSTAYSSVAFDFTTGNAFSAGDQIGVSFVRDNTGLGDVAITLVWEYELF